MMSTYVPDWEDRGFRAWVVSRYSSTPAFITIVVVVGLRALVPMRWLAPVTGALGIVERLLVFLIAFFAVYLIVGYAWYRLVVKRRSR
jgi:hypothetical protein